MSWAEETDRWLQRLVAVVVLVMVVLTLRGPGQATWAVAALMTVAAVRLARARGGWPDVALMVAALVTMTRSEHRPLEGVGGDAHPGYLVLVATVLVVLAALPATHSWLVLALVVAVYVGAHAGLVAPGGLALEAVAATTTAAGAATVLWGLRRSIARSDELAEHQRTVRAVAQSQRAQTEARLEARRLLHDHLIGALVLIGSRADSQPAAAAASSALDALDAVEEPGTEQVWTLDQADLGIDVRIDGPDEDVARTVPKPVSSALFDATLEALRNVARHAETDRATVRFRGGADAVTVEIVDYGRGFDPRTTRGFGLDSSIRARVAEVGGRAEIESSPGSGTVVRLSWVAAPRAARDSRSRWYSLRSAVGDLRVIVWGYPAFLLLGQATMSLVDPGPHPGAAWTLAAVVIVANILLLGRAVRAPLSAPLVWTCITLPPGAVLLGLALAGDGALRDFGSWIVGLAEVPLIVLSLVGPRWGFGLGTTVYAGTVLGWAVVDPTLTPTEVLAAAVQPALHATVFLIAAIAISRAGDVAARAREDLAREVLADQRGQLRRAWLSERLGAAEIEVRTLLTEVAHGAADPTDAHVARRAGVLVRRLRDELSAPGALNVAARTLVDRARTAGTSVTLRPGTTSPDEAEAISTVMHAVLRPALPTSVVVTRPAGGQGIVVTVSPAPPAERLAAVRTQARRWRPRLDGDDETIRIRLTTDGPDALPPARR